MIDYLLDKSTALGVASGVSAAVRKKGLRMAFTQPRAWLGSLAVARSVAAERKTIGSEPSSQERKSYLPRDMVLSLFQARHEEHVETGNRAPAGRDRLEGRTLTGPAFSEGFRWGLGFDYHWITEFLAELVTHIRRRILFPRPGSPAVCRIASDARIVVIGDWGTGEGVALEVAAQARLQVDDAAGRQVHVVHLGDVYYAGTRWEARHRFVGHWPVRVEDVDRVHSWCLNGNHDMYSAGEGLFDVILGDARFARQRTSDGGRTGEFQLANDDWRIFGLDTSWKFQLKDVRGAGGRLERGQQRVLSDRLDSWTGRSILFTHHQPFTRMHAGGDGIVEVGNLLRATEAVRQRRGIDAWFWGHEHRLFSYGSRSGIGYATCMGHGAVLEPPAATAVADLGEAEFRRTFRDEDGDEWRMPGFTVIDLDGAQRDRALHRQGRGAVGGTGPDLTVARHATQRHR